MWDLFFEALKSGRFCVSYCSACARYSWPISSVCMYCASETNLRRFAKRKGKIIEFSANKTSDNKTFGLVEIDGLRLIGAILDGSPAAGKAVWLHSFGVLPTGAPFFNFSTRKMV